MKIYDNIQQAFVEELYHVDLYGSDVTVRGSKVKEVLGTTIAIADPRQRCLFVPHRNDNIFAKIAETLWMLAGRDDIEWLSYYLPRAIDYSDNGRTWRGAYGPRLRNWNGSDNAVDQIAGVVELLLKDPYSRRAVISLWDPSEDMCDSKDIPCNNWLHFQIRNDTLHLSIAQRSSDILWGFSGIDAFSWSVLMEIIAAILDVKVGTMTYYISNLHLYERHWDRAGDILREYITSDHDFYNNMLTKDALVAVDIHDLEFMDEDLEKVFALEETFRECIGCVDCDYPQSKFLRTCLDMLYLYSMLVNRRTGEEIALVVGAMKTCDFKFAAIDYFHRMVGDDFDKAIDPALSVHEREIVAHVCVA